jgi:hypothetical protein
MHDTQGSTLWKATTILIEKASAPRLAADYACELASRPQIERRKARFIPFRILQIFQRFCEMNNLNSRAWDIVII